MLIKQPPPAGVNETQIVVAKVGIQNQLSANFYGLVGLATYKALEAGGAPPIALAGTLQSFSSRHRADRPKCVQTLPGCPAQLQPAASWITQGHVVYTVMSSLHVKRPTGVAVCCCSFCWSHHRLQRLPLESGQV